MNNLQLCSSVSYMNTKAKTNALYVILHKTKPVAYIYSTHPISNVQFYSRFYYNNIPEFIYLMASVNRRALCVYDERWVFVRGGSATVTRDLFVCPMRSYF